MATKDGSPPLSFFSSVFAILRKDLLLEWRARETIFTMIFFAVLVVVIFSFALANQGQPLPQVSGGILWVVIAFAGAIGLGRLFDREQENEADRALLLSPISRGAIYLAKLLGVTIFILLIEAIVWPLLLFFFSLKVHSWLLLGALLFLGTLGFAAVGTLFGATLLQGRGREVLLSIMLYPIVTPLIIAGAKGTAALLAGPEEAASVWGWLKLMAIFDVVFISLAFWLFEPLARGE